jgi:hypothetical protein
MRASKVSPKCPRRAEGAKSIEAGPAPTTSAEESFALMLEIACQDFEVLQDLIRGRLQVVPASQDQTPAHAVRAPASIRMALAKSFVFHARRANRICDRHKADLQLSRVQRKNFLNATKPLTAVRDVNEHGFDGDGKSTPQAHRNKGVLIDETSMVINGAEEILMGPLNLYTVYPAVDRARRLAGFAALEKKKQVALARPRAAVHPRRSSSVNEP